MLSAVSADSLDGLIIYWEFHGGPKAARSRWVLCFPLLLGQCFSQPQSPSPTIMEKLSMTALDRHHGGALHIRGKLDFKVFSPTLSLSDGGKRCDVSCWVMEHIPLLPAAWNGGYTKYLIYALWLSMRNAAHVLEMDINNIQKVFSGKRTLLFFSLVEQNPSHFVGNTFHQINFVQNTTVESWKVSLWALWWKDAQNKLICKYSKARRHSSVKGQKKCIESLYFGDEQEGLPGGFPIGKVMLQSIQGAGACPACSAGVGKVLGYSHQPLLGTALVVFKSWEVARS